MHPSIEAIRKFFKYDHLPEHLRGTSKLCADLADAVIAECPDGGAELTAGLRKLLEAKDCFVRAKFSGITKAEA